MEIVNAVFHYTSELLTRVGSCNSLQFQIFPLISVWFWIQPSKGLMILVSIDPYYVILLSMNYTMYISKGFQQEYFILWDPMCDLSVKS